MKYLNSYLLLFLSLLAAGHTYAMERQAAAANPRAKPVARMSRLYWSIPNKDGGKRIEIVLEADEIAYAQEKGIPFQDWTFAKLFIEKEVVETKGKALAAAEAKQKRQQLLVTIAEKALKKDTEEKSKENIKQ